MNGYAYIMRREPAQLDGFFDKVKSAVNKVTSTAKDVVQDIGKTAVNTVTAAPRLITGKDLKYTADDFNTKVFATGSKIQQVTTGAGAGIIATVVPVQLFNKAGNGGNAALVDINTSLPAPTDNTLEASASNLTPGKIAAGVGMVLALGTLIYFTTENN